MKIIICCSPTLLYASVFQSCAFNFLLLSGFKSLSRCILFTVHRYETLWIFWYLNSDKNILTQCLQARAGQHQAGWCVSVESACQQTRYPVCLCCCLHVGVWGVSVQIAINVQRSFNLMLHPPCSRHPDNDDRQTSSGVGSNKTILSLLRMHKHSERTLLWLLIAAFDYCHSQDFWPQIRLHDIQSWNNRA